MKEIKIYCVKEVIMEDSGDKKFTQGKTYIAEKLDFGFKAINDSGQSHSLWQEFFNRHFVVVDENDKTGYVERMLKKEKEVLEKHIKTLEHRIEEHKKILIEDEEELEEAKLHFSEISEALIK